MELSPTLTNQVSPALIPHLMEPPTESAAKVAARQVEAVAWTAGLDVGHTPDGMPAATPAPTEEAALAKPRKRSSGLMTAFQFLQEAAGCFQAGTHGRFSSTPICYAATDAW